MIKLGNQKVDLYKGSTLIKKAYRGSSLIYNRTNHIELEYLESTGTQFIDTGLQLQPLKAVINLCFVESNTRELMGFGSYRTTYFGKTTDGLFELGGSYVLQGSNTYEWQEVTFTHNGLKVVGSGHLITKFGEITRTDNITDNVQGSSFCLFNVSNAGTTYACRCKISSAKFYNPDTNKLIMDLIPVLDKNFEPCMYDKISGKYLYNQGSGQFKGGLEDGSQIVNYLESTDNQYIDTFLPVTENTGAFIDAEWAYENKPFSTLSGSYQSFMVMGIAPSTRRVCYSYNSNPTGVTLYPLKDGTFVPSSEISGVASSKFITENGRFQVGLNYLGSRKWTYKTASEIYENDLGNTVVQNDNTITLFGRRYSATPQESNSYFWKGKIYSAIFTEGDKVVRHFIPVIKSDGTACMYDLITKQYFVNKGTGKFIGG